MSFKYINNFLIIIFLLFIFSCQDKNIFLNENQKDNIEDITYLNLPSKLDLSLSISSTQDSNKDYYTNELVDYNFLNNNFNKLKINNFEGSMKKNVPLNIYFIENHIYSVNSKGELLKFNFENGKLVDKYLIDYLPENNTPISFSLIKNEFIIGFKSGEVIKISNEGDLIWSYKKKDLLNTPIKYFDNSLIILYPNDIVVLSSKDGKIQYENSYK